MKWSVLRTAFAAVAVCASCASAFSQNYYLVVGAFATEGDNVREFTSYLPGESPDTSYTVNDNGNMLHLYVMKTSNRDHAVTSSQKLQKTLLDNGASSRMEFAFNTTNISAEPALTEPEILSASASGSSGSGVSSGGGIPFKPRGKAFKFTVTKENGQLLTAPIHQVDLANGRELGTFKPGTYVDVLRPVHNQPMALVCGVFGYKLVEKVVDYNHPYFTEGAFMDESGAWVIPYNLERLEEGDVSVMYNVSFYKDAVVMLPSSQKDLDILVALMNENPGYVIRVHAHCNGKNSRKIIALSDHQNFFDVTGSIEMKGSAKLLTNLRGESIKSYLVENGIDERRIKTFGWGGAEMLVDENHPNAKINDRIEIEILHD